VGEDEPTRELSSTAVRIESSYSIDLRALDASHVKDFAFVHGEIRSLIAYKLVAHPIFSVLLSCFSKILLDFGA
jgi:cleavage and polyadenylation specificity factor subunit 1